MDSSDIVRRIERDMTSGFLHFLVLEHVHRLGPIHGYGLIRAMDEATGDRSLWKEGTVYPLLGSMQKQGLLRGQWGDNTSGPRRKDYVITERGIDVLDLVRARWRRLREQLDAVMEASP